MLGNWQLFRVLWSKIQCSWSCLESFLTGFSHAFNPDSLKNALPFQGYVLGMAARAGIVGIYIPRTSDGVRSLECQSPACRSTSSHVLLMTSSNITLMSVGTISWINGISGKAGYKYSLHFPIFKLLFSCVFSVPMENKVLLLEKWMFLHCIYVHQLSYMVN